MHPVNYQKKKATLKETWRLHFTIVICSHISHLNLMFPILNFFFFRNLSSPFPSQSRISHCMSFSCLPSEYCLIPFLTSQTCFSNYLYHYFHISQLKCVFCTVYTLSHRNIVYLTIYNMFTIWILGTISPSYSMGIWFRCRRYKGLWSILWKISPWGNRLPP